MKQIIVTGLTLLTILGVTNVSQAVAKSALISTPVPGSGGNWRCACTNLTNKPISVRFFINSDIAEPIAAELRTIAPTCTDSVEQGGSGSLRNCLVVGINGTNGKIMDLTKKQVSCTFYSLGPAGYPMFSVPVDRKFKVKW